jgi:hypothetical protein
MLRKKWMTRKNEMLSFLTFGVIGLIGGFSTGLFWRRDGQIYQMERQQMVHRQHAFPLLLFMRHLSQHLKLYLHLSHLALKQ